MMKSQVSQCLGFCSADSNANEDQKSVVQRPKHCLTWDFLSSLTIRSHSGVVRHWPSFMPCHSPPVAFTLYSILWKGTFQNSSEQDLCPLSSNAKERSWKRVIHSRTVWPYRVGGEVTKGRQTNGRVTFTEEEEKERRKKTIYGFFHNSFFGGRQKGKWN